jgi:hypothetical protein
MTIVTIHYSSFGPGIMHAISPVVSTNTPVGLELGTGRGDEYDRQVADHYGPRLQELGLGVSSASSNSSLLGASSPFCAVDKCLVMTLAAADQARGERSFYVHSS